MKINFGMINNRRVVTFKVTNDGRVLPSRFNRRDVWNWGESLNAFWITGHEAFRRWKIARKAWQTRKHRNQLSLPL